MAATGKKTIIRAAFELLITKGYDAVSISDIQKATGMSRGLLYHHYKNKEELFLDIANRFLEKFFTTNIAETRHFEILEMIDFAEQHHHDILQHNELQSGMTISNSNYQVLFQQISSRNAIFSERYKELKKKEFKVWEQAVQNSVLKGNIPKDSDVKSCTRVIITLLDGGWEESANNNVDDAFQAMRRVFELLRFYYHQIAIT